MRGTTMALDERDTAILAERIRALDAEPDPRCGDYVRFGDGTERRISHLWILTEQEAADFDFPSQAQTSDDGSWYLGVGYTSFSGSLYMGTPLAGLRLMDETRLGSCWFFHHDHRTAHNGVDVEIPLRVYETDAEATR